MGKTGGTLNKRTSSKLIKATLHHNNMHRHNHCKPLHNTVRGIQARSALSLESTVSDKEAARANQQQRIAPDSVAGTTGDRRCWTSSTMAEITSMSQPQTTKARARAKCPGTEGASDVRTTGHRKREARRSTCSTADTAGSPGLSTANAIANDDGYKNRHRQDVQRNGHDELGIAAADISGAPPDSSSSWVTTIHTVFPWDDGVLCKVDFGYRRFKRPATEKGCPKIRFLLDPDRLPRT